MNEKHSAICKLTFYETSSVSVNSVYGKPVAKLTIQAEGCMLPVVGCTLSEIRSSTGSFVDVELSARITDTSSVSEDRLLLCAYRYGVLVLEYTDGSKRVFGSNQAPVIITYEKTGIPAAFVLAVKGAQPEFSKLLT